LLGSQSWQEGVAQTGRNRTINRQKFARASVERELDAPGSVRHRVFGRYKELLRARAGEPSFHPLGEQRVLSLDSRVFAVLRIAPSKQSRCLCLHNVSNDTCTVQIEQKQLGWSGAWRDLSGGRSVDQQDGVLSVPLGPYAVRWLGTAVALG
jgi:sucrose phosphorylase